MSLKKVKKGQAFVKGVSVLDSNPNAYKYVKKKMRKAQDGGIFAKIGNFMNSGAGDLIINGIGTIASSIQGNKASKKELEAKDAEMKSFKQNTWKNKYIEALKHQNELNPNESDIVKQNNAYNEASALIGEEVADKQAEIDNQKIAIQNYFNNQRDENISNIIQQAVNFIAKPKTNKQPVTTTSSSTSTPITSSPSLSTPSYFDSYISQNIFKKNGQLS